MMVGDRGGGLVVLLVLMDRLKNEWELLLLRLDALCGRHQLKQKA